MRLMLIILIRPTTSEERIVNHCSFRTRDEASTSVFEYIEVFYNRQRRHQLLDYVSPLDYEREAGVA